MAWPMGVIMRIMTSDDDDEIAGSLKMLMGATSGLGLIHESVNTFDDTNWSRSWYVCVSLSGLKPGKVISANTGLGSPGQTASLARCSSISRTESPRFYNVASKTKRRHMIDMYSR